MQSFSKVVVPISTPIYSSGNLSIKFIVQTNMLLKMKKKKGPLKKVLPERLTLARIFLSKPRCFCHPMHENFYLCTSSAILNIVTNFNANPLNWFNSYTLL